MIPATSPAYHCIPHGPLCLLSRVRGFSVQIIVLKSDLWQLWGLQFPITHGVELHVGPITRYQGLVHSQHGFILAGFCTDLFPSLRSRLDCCTLIAMSSPIKLNTSGVLLVCLLPSPRPRLSQRAKFNKCS